MDMVCLFLLAAVLFFVIVMAADGNRFVKREYTIYSSKIQEEFTFAVIADLHNKQYGYRNKKLFLAIDHASPDFCIAAGDIVTAKPGMSYASALDFMERLASKYPVYYGIGNHEYRMRQYPKTYGDDYKIYTERLRRAGICVLENESVKRNETVRITGAMIQRRFYTRFQTVDMEKEYLDGLLGSADKDIFEILIAHNPDYFPEYASWGADLVLSGHVHGGVMRLPFLGGVVSPKCTFFPHYDGGLYQEGNSTMILSRGLGMHTVPIRIFNPGELPIIHVIPCKQKNF